MPVTLYDFFRIGQKYHELLHRLYDLTVDDDELLRLTGRLAPEGTSADAAIDQLREYEFLQVIEGAERFYRLTPHVERLVGKLLKRQHETSAPVIQGFLAALQEIGPTLEEALRAKSMEQIRLAIRSLENLVIEVRELAHANLESITTQVEDLAQAREELSTQERFERINYLWQEIIVPLQELIEVHSPFDTSLDQIVGLLSEVYRHFHHHSMIRRRSASARAQVIAMRRELLERHREVVREVEPLYRRLRLETRLATGAARALQRVRHEGAAALELDDHIALFGWRPESLLSDDALRSYIATVADYRPPEDVVISAPGEPIEPPILRSEEVRAALLASVPVNDVLQFFLNRWPDKPLRVLLQAYSWVYCAEFGPVEFHPSLPRHRYPHKDRVVIARPVTLREVRR